MANKIQRRADFWKPRNLARVSNCVVICVELRHLPFNASVLNCFNAD
ncbi:hypothetical protein SAMN06298226_0728 [Nitrosovibrio sp. Nv4]|nr:hypothetical protein SAMN06298226_0728 [Nitrosovibrio sp. Nv4]